MKVGQLMTAVRKNLKVDEQPQYLHDCSVCVFLGGYTFEDQDYDLYLCPNEMFSGITLIARWSGFGADYSSGMPFAVAAYFNDAENNRPLAVALARALERGLLTFEHPQLSREIWFRLGEDSAMRVWWRLTRYDQAAAEFMYEHIEKMRKLYS